MPRMSLQLNDFSGGLNTKSSPRDIAPNQVQKADNAFLSNPGLIQATSDATSKSSSETITHIHNGNGAFIFNSQYNVDVDGTATQPTQTIAYPINKGVGNSTIQFFRRNFDSTGDFSYLDYTTTNTEIDMQVTGAIKPVYYFVDGLLYVSNKLAVDSSITSEPKKLTYVESNRFGQDITGWYDTTTKVETSTTQFEDIAQSDSFSTNPSLAGEFSIILQTDPTINSLTYTNKQQNNVDIVTRQNPDLDPADEREYDIGITDKIIYLKAGTENMTGAFSDGDIFFINGEGFRVRGVNVLSPNTTVQLVVDRNIYGTGALEHGLSSNVKEQAVDTVSVTAGGWEPGSYEFCHTVVDLQDNETLPQTPKSNLFNITTGSYFYGVKFRIKDTGFITRKNEKGVRVYTRKKGGNGRWILFLDVDYYQGVRKNLFEDYEPFVEVATDYNENEKAFDIVNPSLDTYESINGYSQDEEGIDFGTKGGYKAATICARRAWVGNVRKNDTVYDDRIYYSPVNRFATFPDTFYLDIGISDGDSFTALHSLGNRLLAFKQRKLYIINVSSSSDAGWYLEAEYDGMGCRQQESVCKTPFGVCWVNDDGVYLFDGQSMPKEITVALDDATWRTNQTTKNPAIGYNNKYKQLNVVQDTAADTDVLVFDFPSQGWSITKSIGSSGISNFVPSFDGLYYMEYGAANAKTLKLLTGDVGTKTIDLRTKDLDFGNPGLVKKTKKVYVTVKNENYVALTNTTHKELILSYALNGTESYVDLAAQNIDSTTYKTLVYTINQNVESISFKLTTNNVAGGDSNTGKLSINDINIDYRQTNKRPS